MPLAETPLAAELAAALTRALHTAWHDLNQSHFKGALRAPSIALFDGATRLGQWHAETRTLELQRAFVLGGNWGQVIEVLKHEMAHQYVSEVLHDPDDSAHGAAFRALCERLAIDARAAGVPQGGAAPSVDETRILTRIAKLLALAGSGNAHESELAATEAQRLMLKHNLTTPARAGYRFRHLGRPTGRTSEHERLLASILGDHFFVEAIWVPVWRPLEGKRGSVLEVCGTAVNLEMASYVYDFMLATAERLWRDYQRAQQLGGNRARRTFLAGVMAGFRDRLDGQRRRHQSAGLVWVSDGDLHRYLRARHPHIRTTHHQTSGHHEAHAHGRAAGRNVVLHRPVSAGPSGPTRLLR